MKLKAIALIVCILIMSSLKAQFYLKQNNIWAFGIKAGLNFTSGEAIPIQTNVTGTEGCASLCDADGRLMFYTDGYKLFYPDNTLMQNGDSIAPFPQTISTTQNSVIVPEMNNPYRYYVFALEKQRYGTQNTGPWSRLFYSIVDLRLNAGRGAVLPGQKHILLDSLLSESMLVMPGNDCNTWLLVHAKDTSIFKAYLINANGIDTNPVVSVTTNKFHWLYMGGVLKSSHDYSKIVICSSLFLTNTGGFSLHSFDAINGTVSEPIVIDTSRYWYGACFSPDNSKLYVSARAIFQYDLINLDSSAVIASRTPVSDTNGNYDRDLRLGPDSKIYMNNAWNHDYLDLIVFPNNGGAACGYITEAVHLLTGTTSYFGMGAEYILPAGGDTSNNVAVDTMFCLSSLSSALVTARDGYDYYSWNNGTDTRDMLVKSEGKYWVYERRGCTLNIDTINVVNGGCSCICELPSAFTPNGDGINDMLRPIFSNDCIVSKFLFCIYNRWGEKVFFSEDPHVGWNGIWKNKLLDTDTYMYRISYQLGSEKFIHNLKGSVYLLR